MDGAPSRRLRLRFFPEDDKALDEMLEVTSHTSKSSIIRGALTLLDHVWTNKRSGFRVVYLRDGVADKVDVLDTAFARPRKAKNEEGGEKPLRSKTEKSIEIRLSSTDEERIDRLLGMGAAGTFSEAVRKSIRLYAAVVARCQEGWSTAALSPSGDALPVSVPGLGSDASTSTSLILPRPEELRTSLHIHAQAGALVDALPKSLSESVRTLAAREGCSADLLLVDMIRSEAFARLHRIEGSTLPADAFVVETVVPEPVEAAPAPEPAPQIQIEAPAPVKSDADLAVIEELSVTLDRMADNIEKVMQLVGAASRTKDQQAQLTDLFLSSSGELVGIEALSPTERLFQRAQELNERLTALVALTQRERKPRKLKAVATEDSAPAEQEKE